MMEEQRMTSRRSFLQVGLALSATVASTTAISADAKSQWDETTDVLIFGAGQAGYLLRFLLCKAGQETYWCLKKPRGVEGIPRFPVVVITSAEQIFERFAELKILLKSIGRTL